MSKILRGLNGRVYRGGQLVENPVVHPELRSRDELIAARAATQPRREHDFGLPDNGETNPIRRAIAERIKSKGAVWAKSQTGRDWITEREAEADSLDQQRAAEGAEQERQEQLRPLREHAELQTQAVFDDPAYTVEEVEQAQAALNAAKAGDRDAYAAWERQHHSKLLDKLATEAAEADSVARQAAERRDAILRSGINYAPQPIPEIRQPEPAPIVDRSRVAITRKVKTIDGVREVTQIVDAD